MKLIITIDTEEDNWANFSAANNTISNIDRIPYLQGIFDEFNVKPTYLITYPIASDEKSIKLFSSILKDGRCEIGSHCHPWNTPPFDEKVNDKNSMLLNLPDDLIYKKILCLTQIIGKNFGIKPVSFRAGRWGFGSNVARSICKLGYTIDTSVTPYVDWQKDHGPDFSGYSPLPYRCSADDVSQRNANGSLLEIPTSIGFLQNNLKLTNALYKILTKKPFNYFKIIGILDAFHFLNKAWLSPEVSDGKTMINIAKRFIKNKFPILNLFFHSTTLKPGLTDFVKTEHDEKQFYRHLRDFLGFSRDSGIESITTRNAADHLNKWLSPDAPSQ